MIFLKELDEKNKKRYRIFRIIIQSTLLLLVLALCIYVLILFLPLFKELAENEASRNEFIEKIRGYGHYSFFIVVGLQIFQTVFAIIPSGPIVMVSGVLFHPALAIFTCVLGQTLGAIIVYYLVKLLGVRFLSLFVDPDKVKNSKLLGNENKSMVLMFGYLLIPALPKDIVAFIAPFTSIKVPHFIIINLIARLPMTIVTVLMGTSIISGAYHVTLILGCISLALAILCFVFNNKIVAKLDELALRKENKKNEKQQENE